MTSINPATAAYTQQSGFNLLGGGAAQDFFGSQVFGTSIYPQQGIQSQNNAATYSTQPVQQETAPIGSGTLESQIFQTYWEAAHPTQVMSATQQAGGQSQVTQQTAYPAQSQSAPTIQDYMIASQIASMLSSNMPIMYNNTSFSENDVFASQIFGTNQLTMQPSSQNTQQGQTFQAVS